MSSYKKPTSFSSTFNENNQIGIVDLESPATVNNLQDYVLKNAPVFNAAIQIKEGNALIINNETQNKAFTDTTNEKINNSHLKLSNITYTNNITSISGNIDLEDNVISISKVESLQSEIDKVNTNVTAISGFQSSITNIQDFNTEQNNYNTNNDSIITDLQNNDISYNPLVIQNQTNILDNILNIKTNKSNLINNTLAINTNTKSITDIEDRITGISNGPYPGINISDTIWCLTDKNLHYTNNDSYLAIPTLNLHSVTANDPGKILFGNTADDTQNYAYNNTDRTNVLTIPQISVDIKNNTSDIDNINISINQLGLDDIQLQANITSNDNDILTLQTATDAYADTTTNLQNQINTLTTLQDGDVANFVAIDNNFTAIDQKLTDISYNSTTDTTLIYNALSVVGYNDVSLIHMNGYEKDDDYNDAGKSVIAGRFASSTHIRAGANGLVLNEQYMEGLQLSGQHKNIEPHMTIYKDGEICIGPRSNMLQDSPYKLVVDGDVNILGTVTTNQPACAYRYKQSVQIAEPAGEYTKSFEQNIELLSTLLDPTPKMYKNCVYTYSVSVQLLNITALDYLYINPSVWSGNTKITQGGILREFSDNHAYKYANLTFPPDLFQCSADYSDEIYLKVDIEYRATCGNDNGIWIIYSGIINKIN